ncbi:hypothetical protein A3F34_00250 [Candidatus Roizmanbacteria bacterium RIFCSPHIGHO2_12_FULL_44_10]|uniref:Uncharacterized protein n=1 Tax=Candidatus Roizmanbacteria bacterium RIFCSPHIGHO2_12_FULL_44_10 TaxID=1802054 RepID=A0A1F7I6L0_9BACT|nr:MAG: hypothetical protein A3F34_00250 [Candidatus Roizmanbacteria bacterium RIFCSPHIGHO2_12_FULL_44_10]
MPDRSETGQSTYMEPGLTSVSEFFFVRIMASASTLDLQTKMTMAEGVVNEAYRRQAEAGIIEGVVDFIRFHGEDALSTETERNRELGGGNAVGVTLLEPFVVAARERIKAVAEASE